MAMSTSGRTATIRQGCSLLGVVEVEPEGDRRRYTCASGRSLSRGDVEFSVEELSLFPVKGWVTFEMNC